MDGLKGWMDLGSGWGKGEMRLHRYLIVGHGARMPDCMQGGTVGMDVKVGWRGDENGGVRLSQLVIEHLWNEGLCFVTEHRLRDNMES